MQIGIGLPTAISGIRASTLVDWARWADAGPFSSLGVIDRLVYPNYEPLITLAVAAGVTRRIRLMTTILIAPLRNAGVLAKQAASLDAISGGRLTLGLAVGGREDDFRAAPATFTDRGARFDDQLALMARVWSGQPLAADIGPVGPPPAHIDGPELLIGGRSPAALQRVGRWADGFISGGGAVTQARAAYELALQSWQTNGREGTPRFVGAAYFGLGEHASERIATFAHDYYAFLGRDATAQIASAIPSTPDAVLATIQAYTDAGADELMFWPCISSLDQVHRLAELIRS